MNQLDLFRDAQGQANKDGWVENPWLNEGPNFHPLDLRHRVVEVRLVRASGHTSTNASRKGGGWFWSRHRLESNGAYISHYRVLT